MTGYIPAGWPGRAEMRAERDRLADHIRHGHTHHIDRHNQLSRLLATLDGTATSEEDQ